MKAMTLLETKQLEVADLPLAPVRPGEALLKVKGGGSVIRPRLHQHLHLASCASQVCCRRRPGCRVLYGTFTFTMTHGRRALGHIYHPSANEETSDSISW